MRTVFGDCAEQLSFWWDERVRFVLTEEGWEEEGEAQKGEPGSKECVLRDRARLDRWARIG